ncbi:MAG TPA: ShlB/FhaC/HecB family hemolysin secretion/activation protein [Burkholderiaceae bacterium]
MTTRCAIHRLACGLLLSLALQVQAQQPRVQVDEFVVTGNTLLPAATVAAAVAPFKGERTLDELQQAARAVQALYRDAGYGAVVAYLPPQSGPPGRVTIAVLEGHLALVVVSGNQQFSEANIRRSLPGLVEGRTPQVRRIDTEIQLANENPAKQLALSLEAGQRPGEVEARVLVSEQPAHRWSVLLDNTGNANTGRLRAGLMYQNAALWDLDHVLSLLLQTSPERPSSVAVVSASYHVPFYERGMTADFFAVRSAVDNGTTGTAAGPLQFTGRGQMLGVRLNKPLERIGEFDQRLSLGLDRRDYDNDCSIAGLPPGACGSPGASVTVNPLSLDYTLQRGGERALGFNAGLTHNLALGGSHADAADYEAARPGASRDYSLVRLGAFAARALPRGWQISARIAGQWTRDGLVNGEQFSIAGSTSVRGYEEREITGDSGASGTLELYTPSLLPADASPKSSLRLLGFVDAGKAWNRLDTPCRDAQSSCTLASVGLGARLDWQDLRLRLDLAHALKNGNLTERGDNRAHLQLIYSF